MIPEEGHMLSEGQDDVLIDLLNADPEHGAHARWGLCCPKCRPPAV